MMMESFASQLRTIKWWVFEYSVKSTSERGDNSTSEYSWDEGSKRVLIVVALASDQP